MAKKTLGQHSMLRTAASDDENALLLRGLGMECVDLVHVTLYG